MKEISDKFRESQRKKANDNVKAGIGIFGWSWEQKSERGKKSGAISGRKQVEEQLGRYQHHVTHAAGKRLQQLPDALENAIKGGVETGKQRWQSTHDGFVSSAAGVSHHNRKRGWLGSDRIRIE